METLSAGGHLAGIGARVAAVDASAYFSRPGPRLVDGIELMAHLLHPDRVPIPSPGRFTWIDVENPVPVVAKGGGAPL